MKIIKIILLTFGLILSVTVFGQDFGSDEFVTRLPSEQTFIDIEDTFGFPQLRDAPGGPGLGEIIVPVGNFEIYNLLFISLIYISFLIIRKRKESLK